MIIVLPLLVALVGILMYFMCSKVELKEVGRLAFAVGLLAFLLMFHGPVVNIMPH
jgi:hypothetical protein